MTIEVRPPAADELRTAANAMAIALMTAPASDERWEQVEPTYLEGSSFAAWDDDECVGHAAHYHVETVLPGGAMVPTAAIARVGVLPTHRRRGVGSALMRAVIDDAHRRGDVLASLRASEATIYQRYGFGIAGQHVSATIDRRRASPLRGPSADGRFRVLEPDEIVDTIEPLYRRVATTRPGMITRPTTWIRRLLRSAIERSSASFVAVHRGAHGDDGYVHYTVDWKEDGDAWVRGVGEVLDLFGADDAVETALWQYVLDVDLVDRWTAETRPLDDLVHHLVADPRSYQVTLLEDEQWIRILDVDAVLNARTYGAVSGGVVIEVTDPWYEGNGGRWRVSAGGAVATGDRPDLRCSIESLSALILGGPSWATLVGAGAIGVERHDAVLIADGLFASHRAPFCGTFF